MTKFHNNMAKIVDFLLMVIFRPSCKFRKFLSTFSSLGTRYLTQIAFYQRDQMAKNIVWGIIFHATFKILKKTVIVLSQRTTCLEKYNLITF